ncbi:MAG: hypothetical protein NT033_05195 [Candidatus Omnitrophica bacterium]|nr:hypothetical protein [Candidatus Omnitrophota bacterium]
MEIIAPILVLGSLGLIFGVGLAIASRYFAVMEDPRLTKIHGLLPGANCGACGGAGCFGFAQGLLSGKMDLSACRVADESVKEEITKLLNPASTRKTFNPEA